MGQDASTGEDIMTIVETTLSRIQELVKKKISLKELEETLSDMGMELNAANGDEIKVEITAERTDLITPEGLARAINCYKKFVPRYKEIKVNKGTYQHIIDSSVKKYRGFARSFVVKGLTFTEENIKTLMQIQEKIHDTFGRKRKKVAIGVYDLNKINFPVKYSMRKPEEIKFVPLGMRAALNGWEILSDHPTGKDYAHLLAGFDRYPLLFDSKGQILSMPPIINSEGLGKIVPGISDIFVECTGPDEEALDEIMNILATMFNDWGGQVYTVTIKDGGKSINCPGLKGKKRKLSLELVKRLIGIDVKPKEAVGYLQQMGFLAKAEKSKIMVEIPSVRTDIWHDVDLADDIARAYKYNNIVPTLPNISTIGRMLPLNIFIEDLANFLVGLGLVEVKTFSLTNCLDQYNKMNLEKGKYVSLGKNTVDKNINMVRAWLLPEMLKCFVANRNKEYPQNIFEIGIVIVPDNKVDVRARNVTKLTCLICEETADFTKIKQVLDAVMNFTGISYQVKDAGHGSFLEGRAGSINMGNQEIGIIGEINPKVLENWGLTMPIVGFELDIEKLIESVK